MVCLYNGILHSTIRKDNLLPYATLLVSLKVMLNERNWTKRHILYDFIYIEFKIGKNQSK